MSILHKSGGSWQGPYTVDPGEGQLRPNGAFDVTVWQDRLYLVFGDSTNQDKLTLAWCYAPSSCTQFGWHELSPNRFKQVVEHGPLLGRRSRHPRKAGRVLLV